MSSGRSPPQDAGKNVAGIVEPFYTNEDVAVLHDIVVLAQELLPNLPERERLPTNALFNAYYDILPRIGVNADHDSRYARILFKIGGLRGQGTLYEKFEEILSRMGIQIEFGLEDNEGVYSQLEDSETELGNTAAGVTSQDENNQPRGRQRRNSESSIWDLGNEPLSHTKERRNSFSSLGKEPRTTADTGRHFLQNDIPTQPYKSGQTIRTTQKNGDQPRSIVGAWVASGLEKPRRERGRSVSTHTSMRIRRQSHSLAPSAHSLTSISRSDEFQAPSEITALTSGLEQRTSDSLKLFKGHVLNHGSSNLMQTKASLILQHHLSLLAKRQLRSWRDKALQLRNDNAILNKLALDHDRRALLHQAVDTWYNRFIERRQIFETKQFFAHLEQRAVGARDGYLQHRAFSHWRNYAFDEVERTSIARRHILRTRTFNAWRDITAVNELKVRRQVSKKFFNIWKRHYGFVSSNHATAIQNYEANLVEKIYRKWVRKVWDIKATTWWAESAKKRALLHWTTVARTISDHKLTAENERSLQLAWNAWRVWRAKTHDRVQHDQEAKSFYQSRICSVAIRKWRRETRVIPAKNTLQADVNVRLIRDTFALWLHRSRQERQAAAVDKLRIVREAWTNWRHKLRFQVLRARVNSHIVLQSVYKWVLAERSILAKRLINQRLLLKCLQDWAYRWKALRGQKWDQEDLAQAFAMQKTRSLTLSRWHSRTQTQQQRQAVAVSFNTSRLLGGLLSQWQERTHHLQQLERWSHNAEFYFLGSKSLKRWKVSIESAKREKRKAAYAQVRRTTKRNLARGVLFGWRHQAQEILDLRARAFDLNHNRTVIIGMDIFDRWRARTEDIQELDSICREKILRKRFIAWRDRALAFQDLEVEAIINFQERAQSSAIKKWSLLALQLRAQSRYASEIREKNVKRSFRKAFVYWQQRTAQKRPIESSHREAHSPLGTTARAETWSELGDAEIDEWAKGLDEVNASTPIPGYLRTPSKRMERVTAAAARFSSTTPRAPLPSPFERHLRAQYSGGMLPLLRKGPGRSHLGMGAEFADIAATGANDDHEIT